MSGDSGKAEATEGSQDYKPARRNLFKEALDRRDMRNAELTEVIEDAFLPDGIKIYISARTFFDMGASMGHPSPFSFRYCMEQLESMKLPPLAKAKAFREFKSYLLEITAQYMGEKRTKSTELPVSADFLGSDVPLKTKLQAIGEIQALFKDQIGCDNCFGLLDVAEGGEYKIAANPTLDLGQIANALEHMALVLSPGTQEE